LFALPVLGGAIYLTWWAADQKRRIHVAAAALICSVLYIGCAFYSKVTVIGAMSRTIEQHNLAATNAFATPAPYSILLWFCDVEVASGHYVGYRSVFDKATTLSLNFFPRGDALLDESSDDTAVTRLKKFSQGFYVIEERQDTLTFNDLRFGQIAGWEDPGAQFAFYYYLRPRIGNAGVMQRGRATSSRLSAIRGMGKRIVRDL
jgi:inner membrane protein